MFYFSIHHNSLGSKTSILQRKDNFCAIEKRKAFFLLTNLRDEAVFTLSSFIHKQMIYVTLNIKQYSLSHICKFKITT